MEFLLKMQIAEKLNIFYLLFMEKSIWLPSIKPLFIQFDTMFIT